MLLTLNSSLKSSGEKLLALFPLRYSVTRTRQRPRRLTPGHNGGKRMFQKSGYCKQTRAVFHGLLLILGMQSTAWADTVTRGPCLQTGSDQQVTIHWRTDVDSSSRVYFGTSPSSLDHTAESPQSGTEHVVKLDGLSPFTRYYYKVQAGSTRIGDTSNTFVTAPQSGKHSASQGMGTG